MIKPKLFILGDDELPTATGSDEIDGMLVGPTTVNQNATLAVIISEVNSMEW